MLYEAALPLLNDDGYYEMRLESIGGLGANLCGKMLGELGAYYLPLNSASFSSYGSEKRGSPVKAFVRWCPEDTDIRINSPVVTPHILALFHEAMAGKMAVTAGIIPASKIILNTVRSPDNARDYLKLPYGELYCIDAAGIARECKSRVNMVILGAITRASGFIPLDAVEEMVENTIGRKYPDLLAGNQNAVKRGYEEVNVKNYPKDGAYEQTPFREGKSEWGYNNAPLGGTNPCFGSMISNDLSPSREGYIPVFHKEKCINCGLCDTTCPDMVFQFQKGEYRGREAMVNTGLDYYHCKGCLRCVDVCPVGALTRGLEHDYPEKPYFVKNKDLIPDHLSYEKTGANSWITSDSDQAILREDGGME